MRRRPNRRRRAAFAAGFAVVALMALGAGATFYTDLLWFQETGFEEVFWGEIRTKALLGVVFGGAFAAVLLANLWIVQKITSPQRLFTVPDEVLARYRATLRPYVKWLVIGGSLLFGLFAGSGATSQWRRWLLFENAADFGQTDLVFGKDLGFYVFRLPFHRFLFTWGLSSLIIVALAVAAAHYFMGGIRVAPRGERVAPEVRAHLSVLLGGVVLLKAWGYRLDQFDLLLSPRGTVTGASYTDVNAQLPALRLLVIMALVVGVLFLVNVRIRAWILPLGGIGLLALTSIFAGGVYPAVVQRLRVNPVERIREAPFIGRNIEATRAAFGIDGSSVKVERYAAKPGLARGAVGRSSDIVQNIRLWSPDVLAAAYQQLQRILPLYEFLDVDVDRYKIGGRTLQVLLSPREISQRGLPDETRTWVNSHLVYTHGFGLVASRVNEATGEGQPVFLLKDIPPEGPPGGLSVKEPRVYYGEQEEVPFVIAGSAEKEFDFPSGDTFEETIYEGKGGVRLSGFLRRAAFAWRFRDVNLVISGALKRDSRILFRRDIRSRVRRVAPFLQFDGDPYSAIVDGRLVWIVDAYTTTDMYPYSERIDAADSTNGNLRGTINYVRNSVKTVVDAYDGTVTLYRWNEEDPVLKAWSRAFPGILTPRSKMSKDLVAHLRYPEDLFNIQTEQYTLYHVTDADDFYSRKDVWAVPTDPRPGGAQPTKLPAYYLLTRLPGEKEAEFVLIRPLTPNRRQNMIAWMAARSDPGKYGQIRTFLLPKQRVVFGPEQVFSRINSNREFSRERTLLGQGGSQVVFGNLLVIPIEDSFLYVQPLYLIGQGSQLPELKRVVVVSGEEVSMGDTLEDALAGVFGETARGEPEQPRTQKASVGELIQQALNRYSRAQTALRRGDLAAYQRELDAMKRALDRAAQASG